MALIKFGGGVAAISGKIAGTVFARNKSGSYARNWAKPTNTPSPSQVSNRARFASQSTAWNALSSSNKSTWEGTASGITRLNRFGEPYTPTGRQIFLESNNNLGAAGHTQITVPGSDYTPPAPVAEFAISPESSGTVLTSFDGPILLVVSGISYIIEATPLQSDSKNNVTNLWRQIMVYAGGVAAVDVLTAFTDLFGDSGVNGQVAWLRIKTLSTVTGLSSPPQVAFGTVA